jgi:catechol 2,3-dioxygenase-like lactoylglutathione lyase family enzyme
VKEAFKAIRAKGVKAALEPFDEMEAPLAFVEDPNGIWVELYQ